MKIATFNVNGVNGRLPVLLRWLKEARPDIVCLQELKAPEERFPEEAIEKAGYGAIWHAQKSWNGVAILRRGAKPQETRRALPGDQASDDVPECGIEGPYEPGDERIRQQQICRRSATAIQPTRVMIAAGKGDQVLCMARNSPPTSSIIDTTSGTSRCSERREEPRRRMMAATR